MLWVPSGCVLPFRWTHACASSIASVGFRVPAAFREESRFCGTGKLSGGSGWALGKDLEEQCRDSERLQFAVNRPVGEQVDAGQGLADCAAYRTVRMGVVAVHAGTVWLGDSLADCGECEVNRWHRELPATPAGAARGYQVGAAERGKQAADNDWIGARGRSQVLRGEAIAGLLCHKAQEVNGEREAGVHDCCTEYGMRVGRWRD